MKHSIARRAVYVGVLVLA